MDAFCWTLTFGCIMGAVVLVVRGGARRVALPELEPAGERLVSLPPRVAGRRAP
jgi:hypothetical protein